MTRRFEDLKVWQVSHNFVLLVYNMIRNFPAEERYALTDQLKRAAVSIPANIAEVVAKRTTREFIQSLYVARGSLSEVRYFLILSKDLHYINNDQYNDAYKLLNQTGKMLSALINALTEKNTPKH